MAVYTEIGFSQLKSIIDNIPNISDIQSDGSSVTFKYKDKDQDLVGVIVNEIDDERIVGMMPMKMPDNRFLASLLAANNWNQRRDAHGTFAYLASNEDSQYIVIESHLILRGGAEEENIKSWVKNLINHINPFEEQVMSTLQQTGEDSKLLKGDNQNGLWTAVGGIAEGFLEALLSQDTQE
jgi:hypothetical protein